MGTAGMPHGFCGYASRILRVCLTDSAGMPHGFCGYASRIPIIFLTVAKILTDTEDAVYNVRLRASFCESVLIFNNFFGSAASCDEQLSMKEKEYGSSV